MRRTTALLTGVLLGCGDPDGGSSDPTGWLSGEDTNAEDAGQSTGGSQSGDGDGTTSVGDGDGTTSVGDGDGTTSVGDGDGTTSVGDGDGTTSVGDGDGATSVGDGDGTTSVGDGDGTTSGGDGDGDGTSECAIGIMGTPGANPSANFASWLISAGASATRFGDQPTHVLTAAELTAFDIVILDRLTHVYPVAEQDVLRTWVESGGGLITMAGYTNSQVDLDQQNSLTAATGLQYVMPIYLDPVEQLNPHPITTGAAGIQFLGGWRVQAISPTVLGDVWMADAAMPGDALGVAQTIGSGRAIVYGDEWISFDSEWTAIPGVQTWWVNAVAWANACTLMPQ